MNEGHPLHSKPQPGFSTWVLTVLFPGRVATQLRGVTLWAERRGFLLGSPLQNKETSPRTPPPEDCPLGLIAPHVGSYNGRRRRDSDELKLVQAPLESLQEGGRPSEAGLLPRAGVQGQARRPGTAAGALGDPDGLTPRGSGGSVEPWIMHGSRVTWRQRFNDLLVARGRFSYLGG